jgi:hypothetical protein
MLTLSCRRARCYETDRAEEPESRRTERRRTDARTHAYVRAGAWPAPPAALAPSASEPTKAAGITLLSFIFTVFSYVVFTLI